MDTEDLNALTFNLMSLHTAIYGHTPECAPLQAQTHSQH